MFYSFQNQYLQALKTTPKSGILNIVTALKQGVKFLRSMNIDCQSLEMENKCSFTLGQLEGFSKGLQKTKEMQQTDLMVRQVKKIQAWTAHDTAKLLGPSNENKFQRIIEKQNVSNKEYAFALHFVTAPIIIYNCQRSGVVTNMQMEELKGREKEKDGLVKISARKHKTGYKSRAEIFLEQKEHNNIKMFLTFAPKQTWVTFFLQKLG